MCYLFRHRRRWNSKPLEAGSSTTATSITAYPTGTDTNTNGLLNNYEGTTAGTVNYASTYTDFALINAVNACTDTDGDGITDLVDIDDDNDGVLDAVESPTCFFSANEWNTTDKSEFVKVSTDLTLSTANNNLAALTDNNLTIAALQFTTQGQSNKTLMQFEFKQPTQLDAFYIKKTTSINIFAETAASLKVEGSLNGTTWTDVTSVITLPTNGAHITANGYTSLSNTNKFVLTTNLAPYKYYRIRGMVVANSLTGLASEIYFDVNKTAYQTSIYQKPGVCSVDTDGDGISNHLDLDSDNDSCSDSKEAASATTNNTTTYPTGTDTNGNGLLNSYESATLGVVNYTSTYTDSY
jgi:hypothetical protein